MRLSFFALSAAVVLSASAGAQEWNGISGKLTGGYDYAGTKGVDISAFNVGGTVNYRLPGTDIAVQGLADYSESKTFSTPIDTWTTGGAVTVRQPLFALGFAGDYKSSRLLGADYNYGSYGLIGEYYPTNDITLRAHGGGFSGGFNGFDKVGGYYGGGASYYVTPNLSLKADADYASVSNLRWTNFSAGVEILPLETLPVSLSTVYTHGNVNAAGFSTYSDGLMVRLSWHFGDGNSLVGFDRNGPLNTYTPKLPFETITAAGYSLIKG